MVKKSNKNKLISGFGVVAAFSSVAAALLFPTFFLNGEIEGQLAIVKDVPADYYMAQGGAAAKAASQKLSDIDRIKMISGVWGSTKQKEETDKAFITETEALEYARKATAYYHELGVYPVSIDSSFDNWYSWSASCYRYLDNVFNTYTCYLWIVEFYRYDSDEHHVIYLLEDGTAIGMINNLEASDAEKTYDAGIAFGTGNIEKTISSVNKEKSKFATVTVEDHFKEIEDYLPDMTIRAENIKNVGELTIETQSDTPDKLLMIGLDNASYKDKSGYHGFAIKAE